MIITRRRPPTGSNPLRAGYSLIELSVVIAILSGMLVSIGGMLMHLQRVDLAQRREFDLQRTLSRLEVQFRQDIRSATTAELAADQSQLSATSVDGQTIVYRIVEQQLERQVLRNGDSVHHDAYLLPGCRIDITAPEQTESQRTWQLTVHRSSQLLQVTPGVSAPPITFPFRATLSQTLASPAAAESESESEPEVSTK